MLKAFDLSLSIIQFDFDLPPCRLRLLERLPDSPDLALMLMLRRLDLRLHTLACINLTARATRLLELLEQELNLRL